MLRSEPEYKPKIQTKIQSDASGLQGVHRRRRPCEGEVYDSSNDGSSDGYPVDGSPCGWSRGQQGLRAADGHGTGRRARGQGVYNGGNKNRQSRRAGMHGKNLEGEHPAPNCEGEREFE